MNWKITFSRIISEETGYYLRENNIFDDSFIPYVRKLAVSHPLICLYSSSTQILVILPDEDMRKLQRGELSVESYISESHFNFGYLESSGTILSAVYWTPLDESWTGIKDKSKISKYLEKVHNYLIFKSPLISLGFDGRQNYFSAIIRTLDRYGLSMSEPQYHNRGINEIILSYKNVNEVIVAVHPKILNELLYHPANISSNIYWDKKIAEQQFVVHKELLRGSAYAPIPAGEDINSFCSDFWNRSWN